MLHATSEEEITVNTSQLYGIYFVRQNPPVARTPVKFFARLVAS